jgi:hypothetical protein
VTECVTALRGEYLVCVRPGHEHAGPLASKASVDLLLQHGSWPRWIQVGGTP